MSGTGFGYAGPAVLGVTTRYQNKVIFNQLKPFFSLQPSVIDRALKIPDLASTAAMHVLRKLGVNAGTSTGLNFVATLSVAARHR